MNKREVTIPGALRELHGERARVGTLVLVYVTGVAAAAMVTVALLPVDLALWRRILAAVVVLDMAAGVVANLSTSTNQYYQARRRMRIPFLTLHIVHPAALALAFPEELGVFALLFAFTFAVGLLLEAVDDAETQQAIAAAALVVGTVAAGWVPLAHPVLHAIPPLYLAKLLLGFGVRRPALV